MATEKQLRERWGTPKGQIIIKKIVEYVKKGDCWYLNLLPILKKFPFYGKGTSLKDLRFISFYNEIIQWGNFSETDLRGASLDDCDFSSCDFSESNLEGASIAGSNLQRVNLRNSNLYKTQLQSTNFEVLIYNQQI